MKNFQKFLPLLALIGFGFAVSGCSSMDDNPIDANKMQEIRRKESQERSNFNPSMTKPGTAPVAAQ